MAASVSTGTEGLSHPIPSTPPSKAAGCTWFAPGGGTNGGSRGGPFAGDASTGAVAATAAVGAATGDGTVVISGLGSTVPGRDCWRSTPAAAKPVEAQESVVSLD